MSGLSVDGLGVSLGGTVILHGVDLTAAAGEWVGLIGPNGAGKTTLLRAVHGTIPSTGTVTVEGVGVSDLSRTARARTAALVPQRPAFPSDMRVFDYVLLGRSPHIPYLGVEGLHDIGVAREALRSLRLERLADRLLGELSGGELQQVVLARALAQEASLLLLDEPTSALDIGHQLQVLALIDHLRVERHLTVLSAMHDLTLAAQFCDRLVLLADGAVVTDGAPRAVLSEGVISHHYGAAVRILDDGDGGLVVVPVRRNGHTQDR
jgi:iron complex transport system ATP-binding protein